MKKHSTSSSRSASALPALIQAPLPATSKLSVKENTKVMPALIPLKKSAAAAGAPATKSIASQLTPQAATALAAAKNLATKTTGVAKQQKSSVGKTKKIGEDVVTTTTTTDAAPMPAAEPLTPATSVAFVPTPSATMPSLESIPSSVTSMPALDPIPSTVASMPALEPIPNAVVTVPATATTPATLTVTTPVGDVDNGEDELANEEALESDDDDSEEEKALIAQKKAELEAAKAAHKKAKADKAAAQKALADKALADKIAADKSAAATAAAASTVVATAPVSSTTTTTTTPATAADGTTTPVAVASPSSPPSSSSATTSAVTSGGATVTTTTTTSVAPAAAAANDKKNEIPDLESITTEDFSKKFLSEFQKTGNSAVPLSNTASVITIPSVVKQSKPKTAAIGAQVGVTKSATAAKPIAKTQKPIGSAAVATLSATSTKVVKTSPSISVPAKGVADKELYALDQSINDESVSEANMVVLKNLSALEYFDFKSCAPVEKAMAKYMEKRGLKSHADKTLLVLSPSALVYTKNHAAIHEQKFSSEKDFCNEMEKHIVALGKGEMLPKSNTKGIIKLKTLGGQNVEFQLEGAHTFLVSFDGKKLEKREAIHRIDTDDKKIAFLIHQVNLF